MNFGETRYLIDDNMLDPIKGLSCQSVNNQGTVSAYRNLVEGNPAVALFSVSFQHSNSDTISDIRQPRAA
jgi:hypothetical protein